MVTFFGECPFPPLVEIREHPEFHDLVEDGQGRLGLGVCFGMVGCLFSLGSKPLGKALVIFWRVLLGGSLLMCVRSGSFRLVLMR